jgi:hypothetical protein
MRVHKVVFSKHCKKDSKEEKYFLGLLKFKRETEAFDAVASTIFKENLAKANSLF